MNKETIKEYAILTAIIFFAVYLMGSFVAASFNIMLWDPAGRAMTVLLAVVGIIIYTGVKQKW